MIRKLQVSTIFLLIFFITITVMAGDVQTSLKSPKAKEVMIYLSTIDSFMDEMASNNACALQDGKEKTLDAWLSPDGLAIQYTAQCTDPPPDPCGTCQRKCRGKPVPEIPACVAVCARTCCPNP